MKAIWKYELKPTDDQNIEMPDGAEILTMQCQGETPCLWVLVDPTKRKKIRRFEIFGTGHTMDVLSVSTYVGTYQLKDGQLVFHVFEQP